MISPFKAVMGGDYRACETRLQRAIHMRFSLPADLPESLRKTVKRADQIAAFCEATQLAGFSDGEAQRYFGRPAGIATTALSLTPKSTRAVQALYLKRFAAIDRAR